MGRVIVWTKNELQLLRENYEKASREDLQSMFPARKWGAIQQKGEELGIRRGAVRIWWTPEQIEVLKVEYPTGIRVDELSARLKHSPSAINHLASRLSIKRERRQTGKYANRNGKLLLGHLTEAERGYIAGLFDGEGSVAILTDARALAVHISNTDPRVMEWLKERIPEGTISSHQRATGPGGKPHYKRAFKFRLSTIPAAKFCRELAPLLVIKRDEAALVGEALLAGFAPLSQQQRQDLRFALHTLKTNGPPLSANLPIAS